MARPPDPFTPLTPTQEYLCGRWAPATIIGTTFLGMESLLFGMFTAIMLVDQVRWQLVQQLRPVLCDDGLWLQIMSILNDQTTIESMKKVGPRQAVMQPGYCLSVCCCNRSPYTPRRAVPTLCGSLGPSPPPGRARAMAIGSL